MQVTSLRAVSPATPDPQENKIRESARDFEALLIAQLLNSFRGDGEDDCLGGGASSATMSEFAGQHLAQVISRQGGLGLHELIVQGLLRKQNSAAETQAGGNRPLSLPKGQGDVTQTAEGTLSR